jgi:4-alpha-glucanotransferase
MERRSGILLHITSLPGDHGIGSMGAEAFKFVDLLVETGQTLWQILPLGPTGYGNSPYQCYSAFAGNPLLIDIPELVNDRLIAGTDIPSVTFRTKNIEFEKVEAFKIGLLKKAFTVFQANFHRFRDDYYQFLSEQWWWLDDYALFRALKSRKNGLVWNEWEPELVRREGQALATVKHKLEDEINFHRFIQFVFFRQWFKLKNYANGKGVRIIGDTPLYVSLDSSDVWANQDIFMLDDLARPTFVGGVPPDYFSETGQLWGNPVFDWNRLEVRHFDWWAARVHFNLRMFDLVRIDHFRGLESFWAIPAGEETAVVGEWLPAKGRELLTLLKSQLGTLNVIAEDLGIITPEVERLRDDFGLPGMKVLQFGFASDVTNENLPHNFGQNFVVYTGTHDNDTSLGWYQTATKTERKMFRKYGLPHDRKFVRGLTELAWASVARMAIVPMQDFLGLDGAARMNTPGTATGNWGWRFSWSQVRTSHKVFLKKLTAKYNRCRH